MRLETVSLRELGQTWSFRGSKSRNKVSVGEPAEGSLLMCDLKYLTSQGWVFHLHSLKLV